MEPNDNIHSATPQSESTIPVVEPQILATKNNSYLYSYIFIVIILALVATTYFFYTKTLSLQSQLMAIVSPSPKESIAPQSDLPDNSQTYNDSNKQYSLRIPPTWRNLESDCQKIDIQVSDAIESELNIYDFAKKAFGFSETTTAEDIKNMQSQLSERHQVTLPNISNSNYLVIGSQGEGEINNILVRGPEGFGYAKVTIWSNANPMGDNAHCLQFANDYKNILSTFEFNSSNSTPNNLEEISQKCISLQGSEKYWLPNYNECIKGNASKSQLEKFCKDNKGEFVASSSTCRHEAPGTPCGPEETYYCGFTN